MWNVWLWLCIYYISMVEGNAEVSWILRLNNCSWNTPYDQSSLHFRKDIQIPSIIDVPWKQDDLPCGIFAIIASWTAIDAVSVDIDDTTITVIQDGVYVREEKDDDDNNNKALVDVRVLDTLWFIR